MAEFVPNTTHRYATDGPLVLSMSALQSFKRCRKQYELGNELNIDVASSDAAQRGTEIHAILADCARFIRDCTPVPPWTGEMAPIAQSYLEHEALPKDILKVDEEPIYTKLVRETWLRTTLDLVYRDDEGWIVGRDWKSFSKAPTYDVDLDFQGGIYIAALMRAYKTDKVRFEYKYIRSALTHADGKPWDVDELYFTVPVVISRREADALWKETQDAARDLLRARRLGKFYRSGSRKEFGSPCFTCWFLDLCKADMQQGYVGVDDVALLAAGIKEPLKLPEGIL